MLCGCLACAGSRGDRHSHRPQRPIELCQVAARFRCVQTTARRACCTASCAALLSGLSAGPAINSQGSCRLLTHPVVMCRCLGCSDGVQQLCAAVWCSRQHHQGVGMARPPAVAPMDMHRAAAGARVRTPGCNRCSRVRGCVAPTHQHSRSCQLQCKSPLAAAGLASPISNSALNTHSSAVLLSTTA